MNKIKKEEERHKGFRLLDIVSTENIMSEDPNKVIYEGEVLKFSPGLKQQHYPKWAQITKHEFRYYRDRLSASEWLARPLLAIPLFGIEKVERVSVKIATKDISRAKGAYQFEIFIKGFKDTGNNDSSVNRSRSAKRKQEHSGDGSLSPPGVSSTYTKSQIKKTALTGLDSKDKKSYMEYVKNRAGELSKVVVQQQIKGQGQSAWIKALSGADTWTSREKIWKDIKERHLYGHADKMECEKWVFVLNWVIDVIKDSSK